MEPGEQKSCRIAVIEDEPLHAKLLTDPLKQVYSNISSYETSADFFKDYNYSDPVVVITDYMLRYSTGKEFLIRVQNEKLPIVVVGCSAADSIENAVTFMYLGAAYFFEKPVDIDKLIDLIPEFIAAAEDKSRKMALYHDLKRRVDSLTNAQKKAAKHILKYGDIIKAAAVMNIGIGTMRVHWKVAKEAIDCHDIESRYMVYEILCSLNLQR